MTGSTSGLGRHIALAAAREGAAVAVTGRDAPRGKAVLTQTTSIRRSGGAIYEYGRVSSGGQCEHRR